NELIGKVAMPEQLGNLLQHSLSRIVPRMGFSCKYELDRTFRIIDHRCKFFDVRQNQIRSLVSCKASCKSNGQCIWTENSSHSFRLFSPSSALFDGASTDELQQLCFQREMCFPKFAVINVLYAFPNSSVATVLVPAWTEMPIVQPVHLRGEP